MENISMNMMVPIPFFYSFKKSLIFAVLFQNKKNGRAIIKR